MTPAKFSTEGLYEILSEFRTEVKDELYKIHGEISSLKDSRSEARGRDKIFGTLAGAASGGLISWIFYLFGNRQS